MRTNLITGGMGLMGVNLARRLIESGEKFNKTPKKDYFGGYLSVYNFKKDNKSEKQ